MQKKNLRRKARFIHMLTAFLSVLMVLITLQTPWITRGEKLALHAMSHLGVPYVFNTKGPDRFDCSGLILYCAEREGLGQLPHAAKELYNLGRPVQRWQLLPGDMVCFDTVRDKDPSDHVGFYIGGNCFVHASSKQHKVVVSELTDYYLEKYSGARRLGCAYF